MNRKVRYLAAIVAVVLIPVLLSTVAALPAQAQAGPPSHQAILDALAAVQSSLGALIAPPSSNVRVTPPFRVNPAGTATCSVVNVSTATRQIAIDVYFLDGTRTGGHSQPVAPGTGYLIGVTAFLTERTTSYCRFTVEDGSRTDIRAAGEVYENAAVGLNTVAAIVAAE